MRPKNNASLSKRTCLKCGKEFNSTGPGNRICHKCNNTNDGIKATQQTTCNNGRVIRKSIEGGH